MYQKIIQKQIAEKDGENSLKVGKESEQIKKV